ncbi:MarR family winged helix-turn-helix transcriptional regulator [Bradyrhizobium glycinis]|uniref:MarR family winged helix-turn-helix transcriptional regulator n=1 Tax=Bradyrhizobium glycinis TaxID=2751812 RepID=UPI0018D707C7|nr:MarR family transcriptional regulator [Bradyrhizobium glycinis]MBH5370483.1 MarR family transcriptional regulator [Bradyrhizobium glycinis]
MSDRPLNEHLSHLLSQASRHFARHLNADGIALDEWRLMKALSERRGMTMRAIADELALSAPTTTKIVDRMVQEALVYRAPDPSDRRKVVLFLSEKGAERLAAQSARVNEQETKAEDAYGNEHAEQLRAMLESFIRRME